MVNRELKSRRLAASTTFGFPPYYSTLDGLASTTGVARWRGRAESSGPIVAVKAEHQLLLLARHILKHLAIDTILAMECLTSVIDGIE